MAPKNRVIELQKIFQKSTKPLWWRHPRSPFLLYPFYGLLTVAVVAPLLYIPNAVLGIKAKKSE
ncbi:cytochrome c oxidase subunit 7, mitochondrial [Monosporozyma servazzii]